MLSPVPVRSRDATRTRAHLPDGQGPPTSAAKFSMCLPLHPAQAARLAKVFVLHDDRSSLTRLHVDLSMNGRGLVSRTRSDLGIPGPGVPRSAPATLP